MTSQPPTLQLFRTDKQFPLGLRIDVLKHFGVPFSCSTCRLRAASRLSPMGASSSAASDAGRRNRRLRFPESSRARAGRGSRSLRRGRASAGRRGRAHQLRRPSEGLIAADAYVVSLAAIRRSARSRHFGAVYRSGYSSLRSPGRRCADRPSWRAYSGFTRLATHPLRRRTAESQATISPAPGGGLLEHSVCDLFPRAATLSRNFLSACGADAGRRRSSGGTRYSNSTSYRSRPRGWTMAAGRAAAAHHVGRNRRSM